MEVKLPKYGVTMEEGLVVRWYKEEGDRIAQGELLAEIATDKVSTDLESPVAGVVLKLVADIDQSIPIGGTLAIIIEDK